MDTREPLVLIFGADDNFATPLAAAIYSALTNLDRDRQVALHLLNAGISDRNRRRLGEVVQRARPDTNVQWHSPSMTEFAGLRITREDFTNAGFLRLLIPDLLKRTQKKALYLDCDLIVEGDLAELWEQPVDGHAVLAVLSFSAPCLSSPSGVDNYQELGLPPDAPNFNSGVMVMNLDAWREERIGPRVVEYLRAYGTTYTADQVGLNAVLAGRWQAVDPRWNQTHDVRNLAAYGDRQLIAQGYTPSQLAHARATFAEVLAEPKIVHFTGSSKPWKLPCYHPEQWRFVRYLRASGWLTKRELMHWRVARQWWWFRRNMRRVARRVGPKRQTLLQPRPGEAPAET